MFPTHPESRVGETVGRDAGFSVLEAIVALALLGAVIVPLLLWQAQMSRDTSSIERSLSTRIAEGVALRYLQLLNPIGPSSGEQALGGGWTMSWSAEPMTEPRGLRSGVTDVGRHRGTLFAVRGELRSSGGGVVVLETHVTGVEELRPFDPR